MIMHSDRAQMIAHEENRKSVGMAYLLLFLFGSLAVHRFYLGANNSGVLMLVLTLLAMLLAANGMGFLLFIPIGIWLLADTCLLSDMTRRRNMELLDDLD